MNKKKLYFSMELTGNDVDKVDPLKIWRELDEKLDVNLTSLNIQNYESEDTSFN